MAAGCFHEQYLSPRIQEMGDGRYLMTASPALPTRGYHTAYRKPHRPSHKKHQ